MDQACLARLSQRTTLVDLIVVPGCGDIAGILSSLLKIGKNLTSVTMIPVETPLLITRADANGLLVGAVYTICAQARSSSYQMYLNLLVCLFESSPTYSQLFDTAKKCSSVYFGPSNASLLNDLDQCAISNVAATTAPQLAFDTETPAIYIDGQPFCGALNDLGSALCESSLLPSVNHTLFPLGTLFKGPSTILNISACSSGSFQNITMCFANQGEFSAFQDIVPAFSMFFLSAGILLIMFCITTRRRQAYQRRRTIVMEDTSGVVHLFMLARIAARSEEERLHRPTRIADALSKLSLHFAPDTPVDVCSICLDLVGETYYELNCKHVFHRQCILRWWASNDSCPLCRLNLLDVTNLLQSPPLEATTAVTLVLKKKSQFSTLSTPPPFKSIFPYRAVLQSAMSSATHAKAALL